MSNKKKAGAEIQVQKSPAEFFAENQAIAGFDNLGKSLYTSIRELVENGLDACEAVHQLPEIAVDIKEYTQAEFNKLTTNDLRLSTNPAAVVKALSPDHRKHQQVDPELFQKKGRKSVNKEEDDVVEDEEAGDDSKKKKAKKAKEQANKPNQYFLITVTDNGCGMAHDAIPDLFGRVLSGSKYGVRQTRGKFGLGAKMALIWAKKSTGHPIHIQTAHRTDSSIAPKISSCILDIDIYKNRPRVIEHSEAPNTTKFVGTVVRVLIAGNWTTYKSRIVQYLQQLAIITPYAALSMTYSECSGKRDMHLSYDRRSEQMPATPVTVKHHPAGVNNIIVQQLIQFTKSKTLIAFLTKELSAVSMPLAKRLIAELESSAGLTETMKPSDLTDKQITRLVQLFHQVQLFRPPDGSCLSPLGEYNLNLGIHKVYAISSPPSLLHRPRFTRSLAHLPACFRHPHGIHDLARFQVLEPELIATTRDKVSAYEGHPFVIEAAVSLGGKNVKEGVTVYRFANRIPLLFEGGADVATRVALTKIRWNNYKIDYKRDKVAVFVSIVSTKIPFKGTSKEYIGDDGKCNVSCLLPLLVFYSSNFVLYAVATEIHHSVKRALQSCCQQLRLHLMKRNALKDAKTRKSKLIKYIPDVSRSLFGLLDGMRKRKAAGQQPASLSNSPTKRLRLDATAASQMIKRLDRNEITEDTIHQLLTETIEAENPELDAAAAKDADLAAKAAAAVPLYIVPLYNLDDPAHDIQHPLFTFRPIVPFERIFARFALTDD
jgi:DNA topoisomerase VI subunit B